MFIPISWFVFACLFVLFCWFCLFQTCKVKYNRHLAGFVVWLMFLSLSVATLATVFHFCFGGRSQLWPTS